MSLLKAFLLNTSVKAHAQLYIGGTRPTRATFLKMPGSNYHPTFEADISALLKAHEIEDAALSGRKRAFDRLRHSVLSFGNGFDLLDSSLSGFSRERPLIHEPLVCSIIDSTRPKGLQAEDAALTPPMPYDSQLLAAALSARGYRGSYIDARPDLIGTDRFTSLEERNDHLESQQEELNWSTNPMLFSIKFDVLQPSLRIEARSDDEPAILLTPAHPSNFLRHNFIGHSSTISSNFVMVSRLFWLWAQSWGLGQFSPSLCAYMVIHNLLRGQCKESPGEASFEPPHIYLKLLWQPKPVFVSVQAPRLPTCASNAGCLSQIESLLSFWDYRGTSFNAKAYKPATGRAEERIIRYKFVDEDILEKDATKLLISSRPSVKEGRIDGDPAIWRYQPLVVCDPIVQHHNAAFEITKDVIEHLSQRARQCVRSMRSGDPAINILGAATGLVRPRRYLGASHVTLNPFTIRQHQYHTHSSDFFSKRPIPRSVYQDRSKTIQRVNDAIVKAYGNKYHVECFGSTRYGVDSPSSDLDLSIIDSERPNGFAPSVDAARLPEVYNIRGLAKHLSNSGFRILACIPETAVPIVKFIDRKTNMNCDINVNDQLGVFNTLLIRRYCELFPILPPLLLALKKWAKSLGLNDPAGAVGPATLSSYALTLMTIGFLQMQSLLPNLQSGFGPLPDNPKSVFEDGFWLRSRVGDTRIRCDPRFLQDMMWKPPAHAAHLDLRDALRGWFEFYGHVHDYNMNIVSIRNGGIIKRALRSTAEEAEEKRREKLLQRQTKKRAVQEQSCGQNKPLPSPAPTQTILVSESDADTGIESQDNIKEEADATETSEAEQLGQVNEGFAPAEANPDEEAIHESQNLSLSKSDQPAIWAQSLLVVADPFILMKNATGNMTKHTTDRFIAECKRASFLLEAGCTYNDLLGDESPLVRTPGRRRERAGKEKHKRGRGVKHEGPERAQIRNAMRDVEKPVSRSPQPESRGREEGSFEGDGQIRKGKSKTRSRSVERSQSTAH